MFDYNSMKFFDGVKAALKLPHHCQRLVIEAEVGKPLKFYVCGIVSGEAVPDIVQAVKDVAVSPDGVVTVTALDPV